MSEPPFGPIGQIGTNDEVRAVVLTGAGPRSFGGQRRRRGGRPPGPVAARNRRDYCDALRVPRKPVIAAAYGGGLEPPLSFDVRLA